MYNLSEETKELFQSQSWKVDMTITLASDDVVLTVTDANLVMGTLTVDRYVSTGTELPVGTAAAGELSFTLDNSGHDYDGVIFAGAEIYLQFYVVDPADGTSKYLPIGYFTVDEAPRILETVRITALDAMVQFDFVPELTVAFPCTVKALAENLASLAGITVYGSLTGLPNYNYTIQKAPENIGELTARQLLQYCCQIMGVNAQINRGKQLYLAPYSSAEPTVSIGEEDRYSSDLREDITVTGVSVTSSTGDTAMDGEEGYVLEIKDNPLIQGDPATLDFSFLRNITFAPFTAVTVPMPWMFPMDRMTFLKNGVGHAVYITKMTQTVNANTAFEGTGLSEVRKGYATIDPLTVREQQILRDIRTRASEAVSAAEQNAISFSNVIANSLGLYDLSEENGDGSTTFYFGDQETLADSNVIYTFRQNGFAWTNDWNGGSPTWNYGIESNGNAILRLLTLYKLTADQIEAGSITANEINLTVNDAIFGSQSVNDVIDNNATVNGAKDQANANKSTLDSQKDYIRIGQLPDNSYGVAIGTVSGSNFIMGARFVKNELTFYDASGHKVAWISSAQLYITEARIVAGLQMGAKYKWVINTQTDDTTPLTGYGSIVLRW